MVNSLNAQLLEIGYASADITYLALSHYHYDHTANPSQFTGATWLVQQVERNAMFADPPPRVTQPSTHAALGNAKTVIVNNEDHDVFGDGDRHYQMGSWAHPRPPDVVFEAGKDGWRFAVR